MTLEEIRKLSVGDRVELTYVVTVIRIDEADGQYPVYAKAEGQTQPDWRHLAAFANAKVLPAPFKVGERVTWGSGSYGVPIVHIDEEAKLAVVYETGVARAVDLALLRRPDA